MIITSGKRGILEIIFYIILLCVCHNQNLSLLFYEYQIINTYAESLLALILRPATFICSSTLVSLLKDNVNTLNTSSVCNQF